MPLTASWKKHTLIFRFEAGTSRGVLTTKDTWYLQIHDTENPSIVGIGECGPLKGLSPDDRPEMEEKLREFCANISSLSLINFSTATLLQQFSLHEYPSVLFGLETALLDLQQGGKRVIIPSSFSSGHTSIPINGLVWMGDEKFMRIQLEEKIAQGYSCIKLKIGAINFDSEIGLIQSIRKHFSPEQITIRVDANGAFGFEEAKEKLKILSDYSIHSIEQPIKAGQPEQMRALCAQTPLPIALDEELIGIKSLKEKKQLLDFIRPQFIILKPTLVGGLSMSQEWIRLAEERNIGWWITSALESNIGLNAIAQFTASLPITMPQGLGTGQLYHNNIPSPLTIKNGQLFYQPSLNWDMAVLK
ncbi:MAG TPA: o-succinylbenzoate synthase [Cytophagaceae bacterium]|nr:o-succinylbenzoate synthase [Cytophagaceae bacterium]